MISSVIDRYDHTDLWQVVPFSTYLGLGLPIGPLPLPVPRPLPLPLLRILLPGHGRFFFVI